MTINRFALPSLSMSLVWAVLGVLPANVPGPTWAQGRSEIRPVETMTLSTQQFLIGDRNGKPAILAGALRIPTPGTDKLPAAILMHSGAGILFQHEWWARELNNIGVATFLLDSLSGRGVTGSQLDDLALIVDAYRALGMLAQHPRIDPNRIVVMGFSRGGVPALYSSNERFRKMHGPPNVEFAAHIGLYTKCNVTYHEDTRVTPRPIRLFHGIADDWVSIEPCRAYVGRLKTAGADAVLTEYPGAYHAYDAYYVKELSKISEARTDRNCLLAEGDAGEILNSKSGARWSSNDPCLERGTTVVYNEPATSASLKAVKEFLATLPSQR